MPADAGSILLLLLGLLLFLLLLLLALVEVMVLLLMMFGKMWGAERIIFESKQPYLFLFIETCHSLKWSAMTITSAFGG